MKRIVRNNILFLYMLMIVAVAYACQDNTKTIETSNQVNLKSNNFDIEDSIYNILNDRKLELFSFHDSLFTTNVVLKDRVYNLSIPWNLTKVIEIGEAGYFCFKSFPYSKHQKQYHYFEYPENMSWFQNPTDKKQGKKNISIIISLNGNTPKAIYVYWVNNTKKMGMNYEARITPPKSVWGINYRTDTLYSNLPYEIIKTIYPDFRGYFSSVFIDSIVIDNKISSGTDDFYNNIHLIKDKSLEYLDYRYDYSTE